MILPFTGVLKSQSKFISWLVLYAIWQKGGLGLAIVVYNIFLFESQVTLQIVLPYFSCISVFLRHKLSHFKKVTTNNLMFNLTSH